MEVGSAFVSLVPTAKGFGARLRGEVGPEAEAAGKDAGGRFSKAFGALAAVGAGVAVGSFFKSAVSGASDLQETTTKLQAIFGDAAGQVQAFGATGAKALGQSRQAVLDASATFGTFGKSAGLAGGDLAKFSTGFASLSTDLASFYNTSPEEAVEAIGAALRGEAEPIRKYGVLLDDASMRQKALKLGLIKTTKEALTPQNKVLAAQALIMEKTKDAQGDFLKTSGGLANQQRILAAQWTDLKTNLGRGLLPIVTKVATFFNDRMVPGLIKVGQGIKGVYDILVRGDFTSTFARAFGVYEDSALVAFLFRVRDGFKGIYDLVVRGDFTGALTRAFNVHEDSPIIGFLFRVRDGITGLFDLVVKGDFTGAFARAFNIYEDSRVVESILGIRRRILDTVTNLGDLPGRLASALSSAFSSVQPDVGPLVAKVKQAIIDTGGQLLSGITLAIQTGDLRPLGEAIGNALAKAIGGAGAAFGAVSAAIGASLARVDWGSLGLSVGRKAVPFVAGLVIGFVSNLDEALIFLKDHWQESLVAILSVIPIGRILSALSGVVRRIPILRAFQPLFDGISTVGRFVEEAVKRVLGAVGRVFGEVLERVAPGMSAKMKDVLDTVVTTIYVKSDDFVKAGRALITGMAVGVRNRIIDLLAEIIDLPIKLVKALGNLSLMLYGAGRSIVQGLWDGISSLGPWLLRKVIGFVSDHVPGPVKKLLGIESPSKVFAEIGENVALGLAVGIDRGKPVVTKSVTELVRVPGASSVRSYAASATVPGGAAGLVWNGDLIQNGVGAQNSDLRTAMALRQVAFAAAG